MRAMAARPRPSAKGGCPLFPKRAVLVSDASGYRLPLQGLNVEAEALGATLKETAARSASYGYRKARTPEATSRARDAVLGAPKSERRYTLGTKNTTHLEQCSKATPDGQRPLPREDTDASTSPGHPGASAGSTSLTQRRSCRGAEGGEDKVYASRRAPLSSAGPP